MNADWYFDFVSPYSHLQLQRLLRGWPKEVTLTPRAILFAAVLDHWGQRGPAEIVPKRVFTYRQAQWRAERDGIPMRFPPRHPFNPLKALRLAVALDERMDAIGEIFAAIWQDGLDVSTDEGFRELATRLGVADAHTRIAAPEVKDKLRANTERAIAAGVFGVPTILVDGMAFWGDDATDMALDYLRDPARFTSGEMARVAGLPVGASRQLPPDGRH
jgi:2-hydroxychromene-2-carboxylate isomerase